MKNKSLITVTLVMLLALLLSGCSSISFGKADPTPTALPAQAQAVLSNNVIAEGHVTPNEFRYLSFPAAGTVKEILVNKGDTVSAGQVLARLGDSEPAQASLQAALVEIEAAQQALDELNRTAALANSQAAADLIKAQQALTVAQRTWDEINTQETRDQIEEAETKVADAEKELNNAEDDFEPYQDLPQDNSQRKSAQTTLDDAKQAYSEAVSERDTLKNATDLAQAEQQLAEETLAEALHTFNQTETGADPNALKLTQMRLEAANAQQAAAQAALDLLELKAPFAGAVLDVNVLQDEQVGPGSWAFLLADTSQWNVLTSDLTELEVVNIEVGQQVEIVPDALPDVMLNGVVEEISDTFTTTSGDIMYQVKIRLEEIDPQLRWGMTVEANFAEQ